MTAFWRNYFITACRSISVLPFHRKVLPVELCCYHLVLNNTLHKNFIPTKTNITNSQPHWNQNFTLFPNSFSVLSLNIFCYRNIKADLFHSSLKFAQNVLKPFLYPLKASERLWITDVFGGNNKAFINFFGGLKSSVKKYWNLR